MIRESIEFSKREVHSGLERDSQIFEVIKILEQDDDDLEQD